MSGNGGGAARPDITSMPLEIMQKIAANRVLSPQDFVAMSKTNRQFNASTQEQRFEKPARMRKRLTEASEQGMDAFYAVVYTELQQYAHDHPFTKPEPDATYYLNWYEKGFPSNFIMGSSFAKKRGLTNVRCSVCISKHSERIWIHLGDEEYVLIDANDAEHVPEYAGSDDDMERNEWHKSLAKSPQQKFLKRITFFQLLQIMQAKRLRFEWFAPKISHKDLVPGANPKSEATKTLIDALCANLVKKGYLVANSFVDLCL